MHSQNNIVKRLDVFFAYIYIPKKILERFLLQTDHRNTEVGDTRLAARCSNQVDVDNSQAVTMQSKELRVTLNNSCQDKTSGLTQ